jgi:predicted transcriptional regulator
MKDLSHDQHQILVLIVDMRKFEVCTTPKEIHARTTMKKSDCDNVLQQLLDMQMITKHRMHRSFYFVPTLEATTIGSGVKTDENGIKQCPPRYAYGYGINGAYDVKTPRKGSRAP